MAPLTIVASTPPKFDAAFLDRRMREHREWQEQATAELFSEAVNEVVCALEYAQQVSTGRGPAKIARLR
jgi:hypothetical protein